MVCIVINLFAIANNKTIVDNYKVNQNRLLTSEKSL